MKKCFLVFLFLLTLYIHAEELNYWFSEYINPQNKNINLANTNLISHSELITSDSLSFIRDIDYRIDYKSGEIISLSEVFLATQQAKIEYKIIPQKYLETLFLYQIKEEADSIFVVKKKDSKMLFLENNKLLINGSKTFALSFSEKKDFDVNQSLYLKLSGEIANNLYVEAQLSDSNSPISADGSSKELSSLDKVFIAIYNNNFELSFGDLSHEIKNTTYINYLAQFEGLKVGVFADKDKFYSSPFNQQNSFWGALAVSKGKNTSYRFTCIEGKQGPYFLFVDNNEEYISIIANSEKIYIDGALAQRGVDYLIDYSEGSITFSRLVTGETEIYATFEYTDEKYRNNLYLASTDYKINDFINASFHLIHRADDKENPLEDIHTDDDIVAFKEAGDNVIYSNGVYEVEEGQGSYIAEQNSSGQSFYTYVGSGTTGKYNIYFSYLGSGQGSYRQILPNQFEYVGEGNGDYDAIRKLTPPKDLSNYDLLIRAGIEEIYLEIETLLSNYDQNTFSDKDDSDNLGSISKINLNINHTNETWNTDNEISFEYKSKHLKTFSDLQDPLDLSYGADIVNLDSLQTRNTTIATDFELKTYVKLSLFYKLQDVTDYLSSQVVRGNVLLVEKKYIPELSYSLTDKLVDYQAEDKDYYNFRSNLIAISKKLVYVQADLAFLHENSEDKLNATQNFGFSYDKYQYTLKSYNQRNFNLMTSYWQEFRSNLINEEWDDVSYTNTSNNNLIISFPNHNSSIEYTLRKIDGRNENIEDNVYNMINVNSAHSFFNNGLDINYNYKVNNLEFYPKVRELQYIGEGAGAYDSLGFYQEEGDWDWLYVNSGEPELSTELNLGLNSSVRLNRFLKIPIWDNITGEARVLISEDSKTSEKVKLYLLNPDVLMNPNTTLYGRKNIQNNYSFTSKSRKVNYRISLEWDKVLDNRYKNQNKTLIKVIDNEFMLRRMSYGNLGTQYIFREEDDSRYKQVIKEYSAIVKYQNVLLLDYLYNLNIKSKLERGLSRTEDSNLDYELIVLNLNNILTANLVKKYLLQFNTEVIHTWDNKNSDLVFLAEKREGLSFKWNVSAKYNYNQYITVNLSYYGNKYPKNEMENNLNIEIKAEF